MRNPRVPMTILVLLVVAALCAISYQVGNTVGKGDVVTKVRVVEVVKEKPVEKKVATDPKATCMYTAVLAYPEYVAIGGEYEINGRKQILDVLPECKTLTNKEKVRMRAQITSMMGAG